MLMITGRLPENLEEAGYKYPEINFPSNDFQEIS
jgi:hypothetical protein